MINSAQFKSIENLIGKEKLKLRQQAHVIIVGVGGVGSWASECLTRAAIGHLTLIDLDDICVSNSNRQIHTLHSTIGKSKVLTLKDRIQDICPETQVNAIANFLTPETLCDYITPGAIVVDAIDGLKVKCALIDYCYEKNIPLITTGGAAGKSDPSQVRFADLSQTFNDPLLLRVRKKLRRGYDFPKKKKVHLGVTAIFSPEEIFHDTSHCYPTDEISEVYDQNKMIPNCNNGLGTCVTVISVFGIYAAKEVLRLIDAKESASAR